MPKNSSNTLAHKRPPRILPVIILSQFAGTSLWFAGNAILPDLQALWQLDNSALAHVASAVQLGFIAGTLGFAILMISDRFSPRKVFFVCSLSGAYFNLCIYWFAGGFVPLLLLRFITGICLAGIYPVGMTIASGWYRKGLGKALGFLVGALVLGTAFPHFLKSTGQAAPWETVIWIVSGIAACGGVLMFLLVPDGPFLSRSARFDARALMAIFKVKELRAAAFGYFGHMWELYALWTFLPVLLSAYALRNPAFGIDVSRWSFYVIAAGSAGCVIGGLLSHKAGSCAVAFVHLLLSGLFCLLSPLLFELPEEMFLVLLTVWGMVVVGDSPQFSALTARTAPPELVGSALTIVISIGFAITIVSIQFLNFLHALVDIEYLFIPLGAGPLLGLLSLKALFKK